MKFRIRSKIVEFTSIQSKMNLLATCPLRVLKEFSSFPTRVVKAIKKLNILIQLVDYSCIIKFRIRSKIVEFKPIQNELTCYLST